MSARRRLFELAAMVTAIAAPGAAVAQGAGEAVRESAGVGEIVVTARRVSESLQDVPVAVTALSGDQLEQLGVVEINDVSRFTPNAFVTKSPLGGSDANFAIRGLRQDDFIVSSDPSIGLYVDGIYLGRTVGSGLGTVDLERVEVLRGPQGTLYGRNTIGGAVNLVSKKPNFEPTGRATLGFGSRNLTEASVTLNGPLVADVIAARGALSYRVQDGPGESVYFPGRTAGDVDDLAGRLSLLAQPTDDLELILALDGTRGRGTTRHTINRGASTTAAPFPFFPPPNPAAPISFRTLPADINLDQSSDIYRDYRSVDPVNDLDVWGASVTVEYQLSEDLTVKAISAYRDMKSVAGTDFDGTGFRSFDQIVTTEQDQFSQELQIAGSAFADRVSFVGGFYYFTERFEQVLPMNIRSWPVRLDPRVFVNVQQRFGENTSYALYGQSTLKLTDRLSVTGGLRWSEDVKELRLNDFFDNRLGVQVGPFPPGQQPIPTRQIRNIELEDTFPSWTPRLGAEYQFTDDVLAYVSWSRGFRSGGFNGRPLGERGNLQPFEPEQLESWEAGLKSQLFNGRLQANFAAFTSDYTDIQTVLRQGATFLVINAEAEIKGVEGELVAAPTDDLRLNWTFGVIDAEYTRVPAGFNFRAGNTLPLSPEVTSSVGASYRFGLGDLGSLTVRGDWVYTGDHFFQASNLPTELQEGYGLVNLRADWTNVSGRLSLGAYLKNAADEEYFTFGIDATSGFGPFYLFPGDPREAGVVASINF